MDSQENRTSKYPGITGETALAIISVALAALWIAFAYYNGSGTDASGNRIMLLHPLVPVALIGLLIRIYRWVGIKFVVHLEIAMIGLWLFTRMLGVLMPFILGFGFAYLFRFLWRALPFKKGYQRAIATILIVLVCSGVLIFTGFGVGRQVGQMTKGLQKFAHEVLLPEVGGEEFKAMAVDVSGKTETLYLGTDHGVYFLKVDEDATDKKSDVKVKKKGITNGELVGKAIQAVAVNEKHLYAVAEGKIYRCSKEIVKAARGEIKSSLIAPEKELIWTKLDTTFFNTRPIQTICTPSWDPELIYVGTKKGLYKSVESGKNWQEIEIDNSRESSIVSIRTIEEFEENREESLIDRKKRLIYVALTVETDQQEKDTNNRYPQYVEHRKKLAQNSTNANKTIDRKSSSDEQKNEITTIVYRRQVNSVEEWKLLHSYAPIPSINVLAATISTDAELYAGTADGMYKREKDRHDFGNWEQMRDSSSLPQSVSLLVSADSGLYAGNGSVIHHRPKDTMAWNAFILRKEGVLKYRDEPVVKEFQEYLIEKIPGLTTSGGALVKWVSGLAGSIAFQFGGFLATLSLAFIVFVYANQGFDNYMGGFINLVPEKHRETAKAYLREIDRNMHQFLKGQFTVIVIVSILSCIIYNIVGVPFALLIGILAGLCNAIPTFGPFIGGGFALIAMLMGLAAGEFSGELEFFIRCIFVLGAILGIQAIDNSLISPKVMSNAVDVDPLLIIFAVIVGASVLGFWGVLLAIPIIVVIKSIIAVSQSAATEPDAQPSPGES